MSPQREKGGKSPILQPTTRLQSEIVTYPAIGPTVYSVDVTVPTARLLVVSSLDQSYLHVPRPLPFSAPAHIFFSSFLTFTIFDISGSIHN